MDRFVVSNGGDISLESPVQNEVVEQFTFVLRPDGPYQNLQDCFKLSTSERCNQNVAISRQHLCPSTLALAEFVAFGSVRAGCVVQHRQLLQALAEDSLNFAHPDAFLLVAQTLWQAEAGNGRW